MEHTETWWDADKRAIIEHRRVHSMYRQMKEYKRRVEELEQSIDGNSSGKVTDTCAEHIQTISQLRKRLDKVVLCGNSNSNSNNGNSNNITSTTSVVQPPSVNQVQAWEEEIEKQMGICAALEARAQIALSRHAVDHSGTVKALEAEAAEVQATNKELMQQLKDAQQEIADITREKQVEALKKEAEIEEHTKREVKALREAEKASEEVVQLKERVKELALTVEKTTSALTEYRIDLEKENKEKDQGCTQECTERMKRLKEKEIDRVEEISYLVGRYTDALKKNDALREQLKKQIDAPRECTCVEAKKAKEEELERVKEELSRAKEDLKRSQLEYHERKSSAVYHKSKAAQSEAEARAWKRTAADMERAAAALQKRLEESRKKSKIDRPSDGDGRGGRDGRGTSKTEEVPEIETYRKMIRCGVCTENIKNVALKKCMHLMCKPCIDERYAGRQRTCPFCGVTFSMNDVAAVYL